MRQKFINFFNLNVFMIKCAKVFDKRFEGRVIHKFYFHDHFARFSCVHGLATRRLRKYVNHVPYIQRAAHVIEIRIV